MNVGVGICQGMMPLAAYNYAAKNQQRLADTIRLSRTLGLGIAAGSIVLYEIFAGPLIQLFLEDAQTVELATQFLRARVLATPLMFLSFFTVYLFQAFGLGNFPCCWEQCGGLALIFPCSFSSTPWWECTAWSGPR